MPEKKRTEQAAVYRHPAAYARENGELELYRDSRKQNEACKDAIEAAIRSGFDGMHLDGGTAKSVIGSFGMERVAYVLANTVQLKDWDGRFSNRNKEWASRITIPEDKDPWGSDRRSYIVVNSHPAVLDGFIDLVRQEQRESVLGQLAALKERQPERKAPTIKPQEASL